MFVYLVLLSWPKEFSRVLKSLLDGFVSTREARGGGDSWDTGRGVHPQDHARSTLIERHAQKPPSTLVPLNYR